MKYFKKIKFNSAKLDDVDKLYSRILDIAIWAQNRYDLSRGNFYAKLGECDDDLIQKKETLIFFYESEHFPSHLPHKYSMQ